MKNVTWRSHASIVALVVALSGAGGVAHAQEAPAATTAAEPGDAQVVVVRGIRNSLRSSMNVKRDAVTVVDAITAEDIGQFPDKNLGEALQRVTGVQITRQDGEGRGVSIRGGDPNQTRVEVNGSTAMSLTVGAGDRAVDFRDLPVEFISRLEVVKSVTPDMSEGGVGGTVRIVTRRPFDSRKPFFAASAQGVYSNLAEAWDPKLAVIGSTLFADNTMGVLLSATYEDRNLNSNNARTTGWQQRQANADAALEWVPEIPRLIIDRRQTKRSAVNGAFEWRPNADLNLYAEGTYATAKEWVNSQFLQLGASAGVIDQSKTVVGADNTVSHVELTSGTGAGMDLAYRNILGSLTRTQYTGAVGGKWNVGEWSFDGRLSYSKGDVHNDEMNSTAYVYGVSRAIVDYTGSQGSPKFSFPGLDVKTGQGVNQLDAVYNPRDNVAEETAFKLNANWTPTDHLWITHVKFGVARTDATNDSVLYQRTIRLANRPSQPASVNYTNVYLVPAATLQSIVNVNSTVNDIPFFKTGDLGYSDGIRQWVNNTYATYWSTVAASGASLDVHATNPNADMAGSYQNFLDTWTVEETTNAAYLQLGFRFDNEFPFPVDGVIGGRYIETETNSIGYNRVKPDGAPAVFERGGREGGYSEFLPSFNMRMQFVPRKWVGRFTATKVMSRAAPGQLALRRSTDIVGKSGSRGNPDLLPFVATQFDLGLEHFINADSFWSVTLFRKDISRFISNQTTQEVIEGENYTISRPVNGTDPVKITGVEAGIQYALDFLPAPFSGFGVMANVTLQEDKGYNEKGPGDMPLTFPGLSKTSYNGSVYYENDKVSARLSYNWRDKWLLVSRGRGNLPEFNKAYGSLDAAFNYNVTPNWTVFVEGVNLTDEVRVEYNADARIIGNETFGSRVFMGVRFKN